MRQNVIFKKDLLKTFHANYHNAKISWVWPWIFAKNLTTNAKFFHGKNIIFDLIKFQGRLFCGWRKLSKCGTIEKKKFRGRIRNFLYNKLCYRVTFIFQLFFCAFGRAILLERLLWHNFYSVKNCIKQTL